MRNSELKKIMTKANKVTGRNSVLPIIEEAVIEHHCLRVTNLEVDLIQNIDGLMEETVNTVIPFNELKKIATKLPASAEVKLKVVSGRLLVNINGEDKFDLNIPYEYQDFPSKPDLTDAVDRIYCSHMHRALGYVSADELRPTMTGVFIGKEHIVATDAHRLLFIEHGKHIPEETIVPAAAVKLLPKAGHCTLYNTVSEKSKAFMCDGDTIIFRVIEGKFPNYKSVIPTEEMLQTKFTVNSSELKQETELALLAANPISKKVVLDLNGECHIKSEDLDTKNKFSAKLKTGTYESSEHDNLLIGFNAGYLIDAIKDNMEGVITMQIRRPDTGVIINNDILLMPMMII